MDFSKSVLLARRSGARPRGAHQARRWACWAAMLLLPLQALAAAPVVAAAEKTLFTSFNAWVRSAGGCANIRKYSGPYAIRGAVEAVLTCQALKLGGYSGAYRLVEVPNYTRALMLAGTGEVSMSAETLWDEDIDDSLFLRSEPLIRDGEFVKAVYVKEANLANMHITNLAQLRRYTAVTSRLWIKDWGALADMQINTLDAPTKEAIVNMVASNRAQFTLMELRSGPSMEMRTGQTVLAPVPGVKVILHGERRICVSKRAPDAQAVHNALNKGFAILRSNGTLARAWRESGFLSGVAARWTALN